MLFWSLSSNFRIFLYSLFKVRFISEITAGYTSKVQIISKQTICLFWFFLKDKPKAVDNYCLNRTIDINCRKKAPHRCIKWIITPYLQYEYIRSTQSTNNEHHCFANVHFFFNHKTPSSFCFMSEKLRKLKILSKKKVNVFRNLFGCVNLIPSWWNWSTR